MCVCSISGPGVKTPHALWPKIQNIKWKQYCCNKFNKDLKNGPQPKKILKKKKSYKSQQASSWYCHSLCHQGLRVGCGAGGKWIELSIREKYLRCNGKRIGGWMWDVRERESDCSGLSNWVDNGAPRSRFCGSDHACSHRVVSNSLWPHGL